MSIERTSNGVCSNNPLQLASIPFSMVFFLLNPFNTRDLLFRIKSQISVPYKSAAYKKECNIVVQSSKHKEISFLYLPCISLAILSKKCRGFGNTQSGE